MKKYLSPIMWLWSAATALFFCFTAHGETVNFHLTNRLDSSKEERAARGLVIVKIFTVAPTKSCYTAYHNREWISQGIETGYIDIGETVQVQWEGLSNEDVICFAAFPDAGSRTFFSDPLLVGSLKKDNTDEIHMTWRHTITLDVKEYGYDNVLAKKTVTVPFYFEGAQGVKYINVAYDISEPWEGDSITFFQAHSPDDNMYEGGHSCTDTVRSTIGFELTNRENQFVAFSLKSNNDRKIEKIYNLPVYTTEMNLFGTPAHYLCFFKWGGRPLDNLHYYPVYGNKNNQTFYPIDYYVNPIKRQCLGTVHLTRDDRVAGNYRADWDAEKEFMGPCPTL